MMVKFGVSRRCGGIDILYNPIYDVAEGMEVFLFSFVV